MCLPMEAFNNDFRCITMDQRNANGGGSTGPVPVDNPWDAFADDQLGLMDHLGIREFFHMGYCIGGCFRLLPKRKRPDEAPSRIGCWPRRAASTASSGQTSAAIASSIRLAAQAIFSLCRFEPLRISISR
jgi:pimeloyl-ACP methyl ester carboxylesterase